MNLSQPHIMLLHHQWLGYFTLWFYFIPCAQESIVGQTFHPNGFSDPRYYVIYENCDTLHMLQQCNMPPHLRYYNNIHQECKIRVSRPTQSYYQQHSPTLQPKNIPDHLVIEIPSFCNKSKEVSEIFSPSQFLKGKQSQMGKWFL